jgi:hypothetical protein
MKGIELPVNAIVIVAVAILVLAVIAAFFVGALGTNMAGINLEQAFTKGCEALIRAYNCDENKISDGTIKVLGYPNPEDTDTTFYSLCLQKGYSASTCAVACGCTTVPTVTQPEEPGDTCEGVCVSDPTGLGCEGLGYTREGTTSACNAANYEKCCI